MTRKIILATLSMLLVIGGAPMGMAADGPPDKKLGYGFESVLFPGKDYVAGQLIVGLREGLSPAGVKGAAAAAGNAVAEEMETAVLLQLSSEEAVAEAIPSLVSRPEVAFVERNGFMSLPTPAALPGAADCGGCDRASRREASALAVSGDTYAG